MIDIHNHVLFGIDDGADTIEDAAELLRIAYENGTKRMIVTPHYCRQERFTATPEEILKLIERLKERMKADGIIIDLYPGNELFIDRELDQLLEKGSILTLANSRYVLVEFPMDRYREEYDEWLYNITVSGYQIIIAHPERYKYVQEDTEFVRRWTDEGYLLQSNKNSIDFRKKRAVIDDLIANGRLHFIASDAHGSMRDTNLKPSFEYISKHYSTEIADRLFNKNPLAIINDQPVENMPKAKKRHLLL